MNCPECTSDNCMVVNSRQTEAYKRMRRYECRDCGIRFSTVEIPAEEHRELREVYTQAKTIRKAAKKIGELAALLGVAGK